MKYKIYSAVILLILSGCGSNSNTSYVTNPNTNNLNILFDDNNTIKPPQAGKYEHIPKGDKLTQEMAYKFLNMATFGATPELATELRTKGVVAWIDEQLNMQYNPRTQSVLRQTLEWIERVGNPIYLDGNSVDDIITDNNNKTLLRGPKRYIDNFVEPSLMDGMLNDKAQLRQKVAYALSQTIIVSESVDNFFRYSFPALAYYYDLLLKDSFGNYEDILYNVSMSPAMATYLTYNNNKKTYINDQNITITPDENYGREIMQLFSIGLYELNIDGMQKSHGTSFKESYTQKDVNEMSKVFTGLVYKNSLIPSKPHKYNSDMIHPLECNQAIHSDDNKEILGSTLPSGQTCEQDVKGAVRILMEHANIAPFIVKKLIMRLTKSNPKGEYISRVARVFNDNGSGVKGDLKEVIRAIFLDEDIWEDITNNYGTKIKEPYVSYIGVLRAFDEKASPWQWALKYDPDATPTYVYEFFKNTSGKLLDLYAGKYYKYFAQSPLRSPSVFNFYRDNFIPNNNMFRMYNFVAPELAIQTTKYMVKFSEKVDTLLLYHDIKYNRKTKNYNQKDIGEESFSNKALEGFTIDISQFYDDALELLDGNVSSIPRSGDMKAPVKYKQIVAHLVDKIAYRLLGKKLNNEQKNIYVNAYSSSKYLNIPTGATAQQIDNIIFKRMIIPIAKHIILSDDYMVQ